MIVALRFFHAAHHGGVSQFILLGDQYVDPRHLPAGVHALHNVGYDGQFFYRIALGPNRLSPSAFGITLDTPYRLQRIGYPVVAWLAAGGRHGLVPWSLIGVNVAALGALGFLGGTLARDSTRHALWGLFIVGYWGYAFSLTRDLAEIWAAVWLLAGIFALRRRRPVLAGLLLTAAVLTRETTLVFVAAVALTSLANLSRRARPEPAAGADPHRVRAQAAWVLPVVAFAAWQGAVRAAYGHTAATADTANNLSRPFVAMAKAVAHNASHLGSRASQYFMLELVVLAIVTVMAATVARRSRAPLAERLAWLGTLVLVVCLSSTVWTGTAHFRSFDQLYVLGALILAGSNVSLWVPAAPVAVAGALVSIHQILAV